MIWILKAELLYRHSVGEQCIRMIEIDSSAVLEDVHFAIQKAVNFDNDHLYAFYISRTDRSRDKDYLDEENGMIYEITLEELFPLEKRKQLYYLFDFGDTWLFKLSRSRKKPSAPVEGVEYPRIIESIGESPDQYPSYED